VQVPVEQDSDAWSSAHACPQDPQFVRVVRLVSQPLSGSPSQLPQPPAQLGEQAPEVHAVPPWAFEQMLPQVPQLAVVVRLVSQPSLALALQLPHPLLQEMEQALSAHAGVPLVELQTVPHAPQLLMSLVRFFSQPLLAFPSQLPYPELQAPNVQVPPGHDSAALARSQSCPHAPQFETVFRGVSHPLPELPSQSPKPGLQFEQPQVPPTQFGVPLGQLQAFPQLPQLLTSELVVVSQPLVALPSQSP
jgi:hypothetical protein